jgi:mono/diheme cytochrome c family protein
VSYARDVKPIFQQRCVICHYAGGIVGYDLVDPFDPEHGVVGRANSWQENHGSSYALLVKPGDPDASFLIYKVAHDPQDFDGEKNGGPMPAVIQRATDDELANIKRWISDGANNDMFFTEKVAPIFGTAITLGSRIGKCTLCHYPNSPTGLNILAPFDSAVGLVGADALLSTKPRVMPGSPEDSFLIDKLEATKFGAGAPMPLNYERLSDADVDILRTWIAQGALDD